MVPIEVSWVGGRASQLECLEWIAGVRGQTKPEKPRVYPCKLYKVIIFEMCSQVKRLRSPGLGVKTKLLQK